MTILPWSHSSLETFNTCPRQYEEVKVLKHFKDKKNEASIWGDEFHKAAEEFIKTGKGFEDRFKLYGRKVQDIVVNAAGQIYAERAFGLNKQRQACDFWDAEVWCRGKIDYLELVGDIARVRDWKCGKNRKKDVQQLTIFALLVFYHFPQIETCYTYFHWFQHDAVDDHTFSRSQMPEMWASLLPKLTKYKDAFQMGVFPPKKSGLCRGYCPVSTCEYWEERR